MNNYPKTIEVLNRFAEALVNQYKSYLAHANYSQGELYKTIEVNSVRAVGDNFIVQLDLAEYWKYIEHGRRKGAKMPPITAIENWIKRRDIIPRPIQLKSGRTVIPSTKSLAFVIARSISINGIKARPFMKNSIKLIKDKFIREIEDALVQDITGTSIEGV